MYEFLFHFFKELNNTIYYVYYQYGYMLYICSRTLKPKQCLFIGEDQKFLPIPCSVLIWSFYLNPLA